MTGRLPVSVFIIALNEADRIVAAIESVQGIADEIVVIDSGSHDGTIQIAESLGARAVYHAWPGYGPQKRFGEDFCRNDWLLNLDADEVASPALIEEIRQLFSAGPPQHPAWKMRIVEFLPGAQKPFRFGHTVNAIRLYDRRFGRFSDSTVHDSVIMERGEAGQLSGIVEHRSSRGLTHSIDKINRYSTMQALDLAKSGYPLRLAYLRLPIEFPVAFLKAYLFRLYILAGWPGFANSMVYGFSRFVRVAKFIEISRRV